ncbi:unnamed protein product [Paramecium pentaurelia]|uniref:Uncharacterized protein n=1 Tax=Paramecium pentaurelia TaxID=43138 RepID=A0A8S1RWL9_9CILI|nr:unnamed protein product [Paramecium pentaurelia]
MFKQKQLNYVKNCRQVKRISFIRIVDKVLQFYQWQTYAQIDNAQVSCLRYDARDSIWLYWKF